MKHCIYLLLAILIITCQEAPKNKVETSSPKLLLDSIADAYGYQSWTNVEQISFTFNVDRPTRKSTRSWQWDVENSMVRSTIDTATVQYNKLQVDSTMMGVDARFINDSYWLLFPFKLVWDRGSFTYEVESLDEASDKQVGNRKVTISYGDSGGYTPGDIYDFYINSDYKITEWTWRKSNDSVARIRTKWAPPKNFNGLWLTTLHQGEDELSIYFSDVEVILKD